MQYNVALIGFGGVNRALVEMISADPEKFYSELGFNLRIVAISDVFLGSAYAPEGLDSALLNALPVKKGACAALPNGPWRGKAKRGGSRPSSPFAGLFPLGPAPRKRGVRVRIGR